jgi:hypothetical protein
MYVQANLPETIPFFICSNEFGEHLFSIVNVVFGMYNFEAGIITFLELLQVHLCVTSGTRLK